MKTKVSQKEWNLKRDQFLCAIIQGAIIKEGQYRLSIATEAANALTSELYEVEETQTLDLGVHTPERQTKGEWIEPTDTRPFNPKVVEIFNEFLPKEIAPLAVEAHKIYFSAPVGDIETDVSDLEKALGSNVVATFKEIDDFYRLWKHTKHNTITATSEQLREWFPQAYENETSELVMLVKENYLAADGSIKKGILKDGNWYAPANDLYKNEGGENE
jgi:hypothetical protein